MALAAKFEIRSKAGQYQWVLVSQGRTLATGPSFARRGMAERSIDTFRAAAGAAVVDDQTPTRGRRTPAAAKAARTTGRAVGKAVGTGAAAVEKAERTAQRAAKKAVKAVEAAVPVPKQTAGRKRATRN